MIWAKRIVWWLVYLAGFLVSTVLVSTFVSALVEANKPLTARVLLPSSSFSVWGDGDVWADGTWRTTNAAGPDDQLTPLQVSQIKCIRAQMTCWESTGGIAYLTHPAGDMVGPGPFVFISLRSHAVKEWTERQIVYVETDDCSSTTTTIHLQTKKATAEEVPKVCERPATRNFIRTMELANGLDLSWPRVNPPWDKRGTPAHIMAVFWWWAILLVGSGLLEYRHRRRARALAMPIEQKQHPREIGRNRG